MTFRVDTEARTLTLENPALVVGETVSCEMEFVRGGVSQRLPANTAIGIGIKAMDEQGGTLLASNGTITRPAADRQPYQFDMDLNTAALQSAFGENVTGMDCAIEAKWEVTVGSGHYSKAKAEIHLMAGTHRTGDT